MMSCLISPKTTESLQMIQKNEITSKNELKPEKEKILL